jgi:hypothetical protein
MAMKATDQVKNQFASIQLTFVSVMIGLVLADLVQQMRDILPGLPLRLRTLVYWGEALGIGITAASTFNFYAIVAVTGSRLPTMRLSLLSLTAPLSLLVANSYVGDPMLWCWFFAATGYLVLAVFTTDQMVSDQAREPGFAPLLGIVGFAPSRMVLIACVVLYVAAGLAALVEQLPDWLALALTFGSAPASLLHQHLLFREWHRALAEIDATLASQAANPPAA